MFPFHSPLNEPKEVSLQNPHTFLKSDQTTLVVIDQTCHFTINLTGEGLKNTKTRFLGKHGVAQSPVPSPMWVIGTLYTN